MGAWAPWQTTTLPAPGNPARPQPAIRDRPSCATCCAEAEGILDRIDLLAAERQRSLARLHHVEQALRKLAERGQPLIRDGQPVTDPRTGQVLKDPAFPGRVQAALEELRRVRELITGLPAGHDDS